MCDPAQSELNRARGLYWRHKHMRCIWLMCRYCLNSGYGTRVFPEGTITSTFPPKQLPSPSPVPTAPHPPVHIFPPDEQEVNKKEGADLRRALYQSPVRPRVIRPSHG